MPNFSGHFNQETGEMIDPNDGSKLTEVDSPRQMMIFKPRSAVGRDCTRKANDITMATTKVMKVVSNEFNKKEKNQDQR